MEIVSNNLSIDVRIFIFLVLFHLNFFFIIPLILPSGLSSEEPLLPSFIQERRHTVMIQVLGINAIK